jgi:hypothetical protein
VDNVVLFGGLSMMFIGVVEVIWGCLPAKAHGDASGDDVDAMSQQEHAAWKRSCRADGVSDMFSGLLFVLLALRAPWVVIGAGVLGWIWARRARGIASRAVRLAAQLEPPQRENPRPEVAHAE